MIILKDSWARVEEVFFIEEGNFSDDFVPEDSILWIIFIKCNLIQIAGEDTQWIRLVVVKLFRSSFISSSDLLKKIFLFPFSNSVLVINHTEEMFVHWIPICR